MRGSLLFAVAIAFGLSGCGPAVTPKPKLYSVKGKVTLKGKPLTGCTLLLVLIKAAPGADDSCFGELDSDGGFDLWSSSLKPGAALGKYKVTFSGGDGESADEKMKATMDGSALAKMKKGTPYPKIYSSFSSSPKEIEITSTTSDLLIEL